MSDLLARLLSAGTPPELVAEVAMELARAEAAKEAIEGRKLAEAARTERYRQRGGGNIDPAVRRAVMERDNYTCQDCGATDNLCCDHIIPVSKGGGSEEENLQVLCKPCNSRKKDRIRKQDERKLSENVQGKTRTDRMSSEAPLSLSPNENNSNPHTHTPGNTTPCARKADPFPCPEGVDPMDWDGLKANRKAKRAPLSGGAHRQIINKLNRWAEDGWPPGPIVACAAERGWQTVFETDEMKHGRLGRNDRPAPQGREAGGLEKVGREVFEILNSRNGDCQPSRPTGPADAGGGHGRIAALPSPDRTGWDDGHGPPRMALGGL